jgi:hypothetical protein
MGKETQETNPHSLEREEAEELRRILQNDDVAPVDEAAYAKRVTETILNARRGKVPRRKD